MHVVIGAGEVGVAIAEVLSSNHQVHLRDIGNTGPQKADTLHICFPWSDKFIENVAAYVEQYSPEITVIHSTVPVGTSYVLDVCYSPVRGRHPNLTEGVKTFVKYFGGRGAQVAAEQFAICGVKTAVRPEAKDLEAAKLWELAQYGINIAVEKHIHEWCEKYNLDFDTVYTDMAVSYNAGYMALGEAQFVRPIIKHIPGPIGGHCVVPGTALLRDPLADILIEVSEAEKILI